MPTLRLAIAEPAQATDISRLIQGLAAYFLDADDSPAAQPFLSTFEPAAIGALLANPAYRYHVATAGSALLGVCALKDNRQVYHLFVAQQAHGQGIARALRARARADALARQSDESDRAFTVNSSAYAVPVYERLGFVTTGAVQVRNGVRFVPMAMTA